MIKKIFTVLLPMALLSSCFYDKEELLYMTTDLNCDTSDVTYNQTIAPIISTYCLSCHGNSVAAINGKNIKLENYSDLKVQVDNGNFRGTVFHENGYPEMPKDAGILNNCNLTKIDIWLIAGAPDN
ncbi:MAG: hypothetical protein U0W24_11295 [Bacteroidales bacterium]